MKTVAKILIVCTLLLGITLSFASCGLFGLNLEKLEDKLEDKGYEAELYTDDEIKSFLKTSPFASSIESDKVNSVLVASNLKELETFIAVEFESKDDAKKAYEDLESALENLEKLSKVDLELGMKGAVVYLGTATIVDDAI